MYFSDNIIIKSSTSEVGHSFDSEVDKYGKCVSIFLVTGAMVCKNTGVVSSIESK